MKHLFFTIVVLVLSAQLYAERPLWVQEPWTYKVTDTVIFGDRIVIIQIPKLSHRFATTFNGENSFKTYPFQDTAIIVVHRGSMVWLPLTHYLTDKVIDSRTQSDSGVRTIRGHHMLNGQKRYFREDSYSEYRINVYYANVDPSKIALFDSVLDNIKIQINTNFQPITTIPQEQRRRFRRR